MRKYFTNKSQKNLREGKWKGWALFPLLWGLIMVGPVMAQNEKVLKEETLYMCRSHLLPVDLGDVIGVAIPAGSGNWYDSSTDQPVGNIFIPEVDKDTYAFYFLVESKAALCELEVGDRYGVNIIIDDIPTPEGDVEQLFCYSPGDELSLEDLEVTGDNIFWFDQEQGGIPLDIETPLVDGETYYATQLEPGCGESTSRLAVTVTLDTTPDLAIVDPGPQPTTFDLNNLVITDLNNADGEITFHSQLPVNGNDMSSQLASTIITSTQTVFVMKATANGCFDVEEITIIIEECNFDITADITPVDCENANSGAISLSVINHTSEEISFSYLWSTGATTPTVTGLTMGNYTVTITPDNSCLPVEREYTIDGELNTPPTGHTQQLFCYEPTGLLPVIADLTAEGENILWYSQAEGGTSLDNQTQLENGKTYYASQTFEGCGESTERLEVLAILDIQPDIEVPNPGTQKDEYNLTFLVITDKNKADGEITFHSQIPSGGSDMSSQLPGSIIGSTQTIFVMKTTANGCYDIEEVVITIDDQSGNCDDYELIVENIIDVSCFDEADGAIKLSVKNETGDGATFSYLWSNGATTPSIEELVAGEYSVIITSDNEGCEAIKDTFWIEQPDILELVMEIVGESAPNARDAKATAKVAGGTPGYEYQWDDELQQTSATATNLGGGLYKVIVTDKNGCQVEGIANIKDKLFIPEGFSPNGDGINDYFEISGLEDYPEARIEIYNRWNSQVYAKDGYGNVGRWGAADAWWDGRSNAKWTVGNDLLPSATYIYILKLRPDSPEVHKGIIFINR